MNFKFPQLFYKSHQSPLMSTTLLIKAKCSQRTIDEAVTFANKMESELSVYKPKSQLSYLNQHAHTKPISVNTKLYKLLNTALQVSKETDGYFDITIGSLTQHSYKFGHKLPTLPNRSSLKKAVKNVNFKDVILENSTVSFKSKGISLDLGGIGKGYCVDEIKSFLIARGVKSALISLGGEIATFGGSFKVGVAHPRESKLYGYFETSGDTYISTSGDYERYIKNYEHNHIIDPSSGSSSSRYSSLTLISKERNATTLDAYNTAMFLMPQEALKTFATQHNIAFLQLDKSLNETSQELSHFVKKFTRL